MILADILFWFLIVLGAYLVFVAYWVGAYALFPRRAERCRAAYAARPVAATVLGLVILVPLIAIVAVVSKVLAHPVVQVPMLGVLLVAGLLCLIGSTGLALRIGAGLPAPTDLAQPWRRALRGGLVLGLVFVMPFLGWFVLLPWTLVSGLGALVLSGGAAGELARDAGAPASAAASSPNAPRGVAASGGTIPFEGTPSASLPAES